MAKRLELKHAHRSVPHHRARIREFGGVGGSRFGSDIQAHPAIGQVAGDHLGVGVRREGVGHDMVSRQHQFDTARGGFCQDFACGVQAVFFAKAAANGMPLRLQKGVSHATANHQTVDFLQQRLKHQDLVRDLGATNHGDQRLLRLTHGPIKCLNLLLQQQSGHGGLAASGNASRRGMSAVAGAECILHKAVRQPSQFVRQRLFIAGLACFKAQVLQQQHFARLQRSGCFLNGCSTHRIDGLHCDVGAE